MHINRGVLNRSREGERVTDCILCMVYVKWTLDSSVQFCCPPKKKKKDKLEKVQKGTTKMIQGLERFIMRDERTPSVWFIKKENGR